MCGGTITSPGKASFGGQVSSLTISHRQWFEFPLPLVAVIGLRPLGSLAPLLTMLGLQ